MSRGHDEAEESLEKCRGQLKQAEAEVAQTENQMAAFAEQIDRLEADRVITSLEELPEDTFEELLRA